MKGIIGGIVGNSVGRQYSVKPTKDYNFKMNYDKTNAGDDSIAIIATADWLMHTNHTKDEYIDKLHYWCDKYNYGLWHYEINTKFKEWVKEKKREPYNSYGNGSAMRVIPVGWYSDDLDECIRLATITAEVTHNHPEGIKGAQAVTAIIWAIRQGKSKKQIQKWIANEFGYDLSKSYDSLKKNHKYESICQVCIPASFICWFEGKSFEDVLRKAVSLGGDADTEAAVACAFAAADEKTEADDDLVFDLTRFFPMDFMNIFNEFHQKYEK
jgi:ADP-ribosylglycohydrolase